MKMNLANFLTIFRLFLLPPMIALFYIRAEWAAWACLALYAVGAITDFLDGWVARKFDQVSEFGKFMDPISDKIFVIVIMLMLVAIDRIEGVWVLAVIIILTREFLVAGMREFLGPRDIKLPVTRLAKWKTTIQMVATGILIVGPYIFTGTLIGLLGLALAAAITAHTGWLYLKTGFAHFED